MSDRMFNASLAHKLDAPERTIWLPPAEVLRALEVKPGEVIADIGAGTGYFSLPLAEVVGPHGRVYAVDAQSGMLAHLQKKMDSFGVSNIEPTHAEAAQTGLLSATCDLVFLANVWHEVADRAAVLQESMRILKVPGCIAVLDWRPDIEPEYGPPREHRLSASTAMSELLDAGFKDVSQRNIGRYSWLVQARSGDREGNGSPL